MEKQHPNKQRLNKTISNAGTCSRREADERIFAGRVTVNGQVVLQPGQLVDATRDRVCVDGETIKQTQNKVYYLLNKPAGYLCSNKRLGTKQKLAIDLLPKSERLFTIGRLDKETDGLLILTNDGDFAHRAMHPSSNVEREYLLKAGEEITHTHLLALSAGTWVDGHFVKPKKVTKVRKGTVKICVSEGRKHEVRLLARNAGLTLRTLTRIRYGGLLLGALSPGSWRMMDETDCEALFS